MTGESIDDLDFEPDDPEFISREAASERNARFLKALEDLAKSQGKENLLEHPLYGYEHRRQVPGLFLLGYITGRRDNGTFAQHLGFPDPAQTREPIDFFNLSGGEQPE